MLILFAFTLFVSSALLFLVQPMIGKMILPRLGGTPAVWNTCMVFFQAALLAGYAYTHNASTYMPVRRQLLVHGGLLLLPFALFLLTGGAFNIGDWVPPTEVDPIPALLLLLTIVVGLPFLVVATSAPLLQKWFAHTGHAAAKDPYFLYGASNLGSMLGLLSYPVLVEPNFGLETQPALWAAGFGVFVVLTAVCGLSVWRTPPLVLLPARASASETETAAPITVARPAKVETHVKRASKDWQTRRVRPSSATAMPAASAIRKSIIAAPVLARASSAFQSVSEFVLRCTLPAGELSRWRRLRWIGLSAVPSSLMLGVTTFLTTDIAAIPFFWVIPLALYLLSFILVFSRWPTDWTGTPHTVMLALQPWVLLGLGVITLLKLKRIHVSEPIIFLWHLLAFFLIAVVCHGELAKDRPATKHLTVFYLLMSVGGVLGGMFNALLAPLVFVYLEEYVIAMVAACLLRPPTFFSYRLMRWPVKQEENWQDYVLDVGYALCLGLFAFALIRISATRRLWGDYDYPLAMYLTRQLFEGGMQGVNAIFFGRLIEMSVISVFPILICLAFAGRPLRFGLGVLALLIANATFWIDSSDVVVYRNRSFFGIQHVRKDSIDKTDENGKEVTYEQHTLIHGGIDHGRQYLDEKLRQLPITYFHPGGPIGQIFTEFKKLSEEQREEKKKDPRAPGPQPFAVVGLGIGTLAAYGVPGQEVIFYEIDPAVRRLSLPAPGGKAYFYYLQDALDRGVKVEVTMGDGRLSLRNAPAKQYQIIVLDAFSSDAIPVHLLTSEAIDLYLAKLADGGLLIFNITNRYVDLTPFLSDLAKAKGLICLHQGDWYSESVPDRFAADWIVMGMKRTDRAKMACEALSALAAAPQAALPGNLPWVGMYEGSLLELSGLLRRLHPGKWEIAEPGGRRVWTDAYSNLLSALRWW